MSFPIPQWSLSIPVQLTVTATRRFHLFFNQVDNFRTDYFLWVTAGGFEVAAERSDRSTDKIPKALQNELGDEPDGVQEIGS